MQVQSRDRRRGGAAGAGREAREAALALEMAEGGVGGRRQGGRVSASSK